MVRPELDDTATLEGPAPLPSASGELASGSRLDHFRIEKKLGAGGMGEVYLATDLALDRSVAIKVLPAARSTGDARDRLVREARAQARVQHGNVGHIYYIGEDGGRLYFAMEHISGGTLADRLAKGPLPVDDALATVHAAALGLREAQRMGFLHRDVKPSNLMLDGQGGVKVMDFGLVTSAPQRADSSGPIAQTTMAGTPLYMAPEQARGDAIDLRADIYALGATLYHLVSGKPPFVADSVDELISLHRTAARPSLPKQKGRTRTTNAAIDALVAKMMAADPKDRFASYDDLLRAIEMVSPQTTRPGGFWVRSIAMFVDCMIVIALLGIIGQTGITITNTLVLPLIAVLQALAMARWGTTPGKTLFELEVVATATGRKPRLRQALVRSAVLYGAPIAIEGLNQLLELAQVDPLFTLITKMLVLLAYLVVMGFFVQAALRVPGKRPPWDRVAGTMVRYRTGRKSPAT